MDPEIRVIILEKMSPLGDRTMTYNKIDKLAEAKSVQPVLKVGYSQERQSRPIAKNVGREFYTTNGLLSIPN